MSVFVFGQPVAGTDFTAFPVHDLTGAKAASKFYLENTSLIHCLNVLSTGSHGGYHKGVIYADNGGLPGALLAVTPEIYRVRTGLNELPLSEGVTLTGGNYYWLGIISQYADGGLYVYMHNNVGSSVFNLDAYSNGPSDPFGTPSSTITKQAPIWAGNYAQGANIAKVVGCAIISPVSGANIAKVVGCAIISPKSKARIACIN